MNKTHGMHGTRFNRAWRNLQMRVNHHAHYKKLGIKNDWISFEEFKRDMYDSYLEHVALHGEEKTTLDRIDGSKNYSKENCRWATQKVQAWNRSTNVVIKYNGQEHSLAEWAQILGIKYNTLVCRFLKSKLPVEVAFQKKVPRSWTSVKKIWLTKRKTFKLILGVGSRLSSGPPARLS